MSMQAAAAGPGGPPRVVLVDDHGLFRSGVRAELGTRVEVVGEAEDVAPAVELIGRLLPDVVLLDVHLPGGGGHAVITEVKKEHPEIKFLALSASDAPEDVIAVIRAGARGYVTKTISTDDLADAIRRVADGDAVFSHRLAGFVLDAFAAAPSPDDVKPSFDPELDQLTTREREVLRLIAQGYTYKEIARELFISGKTVESHVSSVLRKLQLSSRHQLTRWAAERRLTLSPRECPRIPVVRQGWFCLRISLQFGSWAPNLPATPLTPRVPTRRGSTITCSAGRTISRLTARSASRLSRRLPEVQVGVQAQRAVLGRVVRYLVGEAGVRQLLDVGSGLPTSDNVHEIAQRTAPGTRVVYVDNDPVVLAHARAILSDEAMTFAERGDLLDPPSIVASPAIREHLDWRQPIGLLLCGIVHYVLDEENPGRLVADLVDALPPGSYVFIHHLLDTGDPAAAALQEQMLKGLGRVRFRTLPEVRALFGDLELVPPGLVPVPEWRPDPGAAIRADYGVVLSMACAGVARKP